METEFASIGFYAAIILNKLRNRVALAAVDEQKNEDDRRTDRHEKQRPEDRPCQEGGNVVERGYKKPPA
jgi:hypothetical protein